MKDAIAAARRPVEYEVVALTASTGGGFVNVDAWMQNEPPPWYWVFRLLVGRGKRPYRNNARPVDKLRKQLERIVRSAEAGELAPDEFWNVYAMLAMYLQRACAARGFRLWSVDDRKSRHEGNYLVVRRQGEDGSFVFDASRAWRVVALFKRLHHEGVTRVCAETNYQPVLASNAEYLRLRYEGGLTASFRMAVERRLLLALGETSLHQATKFLHEACDVSTPDSRHPLADGPAEPAMAVAAESASVAYARAERWFLQATPGWAPAYAYPLQLQLRNSFRGGLPSFYVPIRYRSEYHEWCFHAYSWWSRALHDEHVIRGTPAEAGAQADDTSLMLMFGAVDNLRRSMRNQLGRAGLRADDPHVDTVRMKRGVRVVDRTRAEAYTELFKLERGPGHRAALDLRMTYVRMSQYLLAVTRACEEAGWYEAAGSLAAQLLELEASGELHGFARRQSDAHAQDEEADHDAGAVDEDEEVDEDGEDAAPSRVRRKQLQFRLLNISVRELKQMRTLARARGYLVPSVLNAWDPEYPGRDPVVEGVPIDTLPRLLSGLFPTHVAVDEDNLLTFQLGSAHRLLRRRAQYPEAARLLLTRWQDLVEAWLSRRAAGALCALLESLRELRPDAYPSVLTCETCGRFASVILQSYQQPAYADTERRAGWQDELARLFADIPLSEWRIRRAQLSITMSALLNLGLTAVRPAGAHARGRAAARRQNPCIAASCCTTASRSRRYSACATSTRRNFCTAQGAKSN